VMNQLQVVALNEGVRRKKTLWRPEGRRQLESLSLAPWASRRRQDLLALLDELNPKILELTRALEHEVQQRPVARQLMTPAGRSLTNASSRLPPANSPGICLGSTQTTRALRPEAIISDNRQRVSSPQMGNKGVSPVLRSESSRYLRISCRKRSPNTIASTPDATASLQALCMATS
jgi:hypothetical protein